MLRRTTPPSSRAYPHTSCLGVVVCSTPLGTHASVSPLPPRGQPHPFPPSPHLHPFRAHSRPPVPVCVRGRACRYLDNYVGAMMDTVSTLGIEENTIMFFASDNGAHLEGGHKYQFFNSTGGLLGHKRSLYEGGVRSPTMVRWPGTIKPGVSDFAWAFWDFMPTAAELSGGTAAPGIDGVSIVPTLMGKSQPDHKYLYWTWDGTGMMEATPLPEGWQFEQLASGLLGYRHVASGELTSVHPDAATVRDMARTRRMRRLGCRRLSARARGLLGPPVPGNAPPSYFMLPTHPQREGARERDTHIQRETERQTETERVPRATRGSGVVGTWKHVHAPCRTSPYRLPPAPPPPPPLHTLPSA